MLSDFLDLNRIDLLALAEDKTRKLAGPLPSSTELTHGLPLFLESLIKYLKSPADGEEKANIIRAAAGHGAELMRLNYTMSHVVHAYGAMCQAVTELAQEKSASISTQDFNDLNMYLDIAIASAVSEFQFHSVRASEDREVQHLGLLVHELRNALSSATVAQDMIRQGLVGTSGSTARVLEANLARMRILIDRSLSDIRMRADPHIHIEKFNLNVLIEQILVTAQSEARTKNQILKNTSTEEIEMESDRQLLLSAIANLIQNALKYSREGGQISVSAKASDEAVYVEVADECGGLKPEALKNLFKPFVSGGFDQSGLGLGLTIVQRAISLLEGKITHENHPQEGCSFLIAIPRILVPVAINRPVGGHQSAQPKRSKPRAKK